MSKQEKNQVKVLFIHGRGGSSVTSTDGWFPYLKRELQSVGIPVIAEDFPDSVAGRQKFWLPFIKSLGANENTLIIGKSTGAVAAMRFAEQERILGSILVAASYTDTNDEDEKLSGYFDKTWNWGRIKENQEFIIQYASIDDPYIPIEEARFIHNVLSTEYFEYEQEGHFGGYLKPKTEFPELLDIIRIKLMK